MNRREFFKNIIAAAMICSVPQVIASDDSIEKYLTYGPDPERRHRPIVNGFDNRPHYPVMENPDGETTWEKKTAHEILVDIQKGISMIQQLLNRRGNPITGHFSIAVPPSRVRYLKKIVPYFGVDVESYIQMASIPFSVFYYDQRAIILEDSGWEGSAEFIVGAILPEGTNVVCHTQYGI